MSRDSVDAETVFARAIEIESPDKRAAFLDQACINEPELRREVEKLVSDHFQAGKFLERPAAQIVATIDELRITERPGTVIGPYKLLEQIGEGGFGFVFMAEQHRPVRRKVALKILKPGMDTRQVVARFEAERQALALMDHPNIAHVFDGGETTSGRPYFVMELVRGIPVTDFCDQNHLNVRGRLDLFVSVCQAVQHAHHKGVIHRDLKPSNIMVTMHDTTPVVKVIDFGIAKATGQQLTDKTLFTNFAQMIGTPMYMSPEQAQMSGLDIDTRTDIYSLGVLLYELLTGTTPFDKEQLGTAAYDEIRRIIREDEPPKPSTRISTMGQAAATVSANRQSDPKRLSQSFRGELDWIVMKALEKDRNRRYETASAFAADVQRYLHDQTVLACPPTLAYRLRKFARRHKGPVLAASLVAFALAGGIIGTTWGLIRATLARADAVNEATEKEHALKDKEHALKEKVTALAAAEHSERDAKEQLFLALVSQARAARSSGRVGQRYETLKAISQAAQIHMTPELRTEAIAALVLPDVEVAYEWEGWPEDAIGGLGFDAGFQRYARLDKEGGITVCRLTDGREEVLFRLPAHGAPPFSYPMSPDGRFVAYGHGSGGTRVCDAVRVWKLDGPEPVVLPLDEPTGINESAMTFHPNGRQLAIGHPDKTVSVYDLATGRRVQRLAVSAAPVYLAFSPLTQPSPLRGEGRVRGDSVLAVACGNAVQLFDTDTARELPLLRHPTAGTHVFCVAWHPSGRQLAAGCNDRKIHLWDTETATEVMAPWTGHTYQGMQLAFNHAGDRLVSHDWGHQTRLWDTATGRMLLTMPGNAGWQFSPDDRLLGYGRSGNKIMLYRLAGGRELRVLRRRNADSLESIYLPVVHADGHVLAASGHGWLSFFDLVGGEELASVRLPHGEAAAPVLFDPSDGWLTGGTSGLLLWPALPDSVRPEVLCVGPPQRLAAGLKSNVSEGASASTDGRVVAVPQGSSTLVLHRDQPDRRVELGPQYDVRFSAVSPDGRWVVTGSHWWDGRSKSARIWDAETGEQVHELPLEGSTQARFSPDGRWLMTDTWGDERLWEVGTWRELRRLEAGRAAAFSPDSRLLALSDVFGVIRLVETETGREVARLTGPEPMWYAPACFTPDGTRLIATSSGNTGLYVWDLRLIRQQLKELGLDWDWPEFPPVDPASKPAAPLKVEVLLGDLATPAVVQPALTREQKAQQAIEQWRRAVEANPDDAKACNNLAWFYLTAPESLRDVEAALPLAEKAVRLAPGTPEYRNTLAVAYYRTGRHREAVEILRPNLETQEDWGLAFDLYFLAMSHHQLGEAARARDYYDWAIRWTRAQRLSAQHLDELTVIRAEAEEVLRVKQQSSSQTPNEEPSGKEQ